MPTLFTATTILTSILNLNIIPEGWARGGSTVNNFLQVPTAFSPPPTPVLPKPQKPKVDRSYQSFGSRPQKVFLWAPTFWNLFWNFRMQIQVVLTRMCPKFIFQKCIFGWTESYLSNVESVAELPITGRALNAILCAIHFATYKFDLKPRFVTSYICFYYCIRYSLAKTEISQDGIFGIKSFQIFLWTPDRSSCSWQGVIPFSMLNKLFDELQFLTFLQQISR